MDIIFINSVKGGSGKTTIAFTLAYSILKNSVARYKEKQPSSKKNKYPKVCYIDLDIMGTGVRHILYQESETVQFINEDFDIGKCKNRLFAADEENEVIDCYLMNDADNAKRKFIKNANSMMDFENIRYFQDMSQKALFDLINGNEYEAIVIDCAPSYDYISRAILLETWKNFGNKKKHSIWNLFVSTPDMAHVNNTISVVCNILRKDTYNENIKIIVNDNVNYFAPGKSKEDFKKAICDKISSIVMKEITDFETSVSTFKNADIAIKPYSDIGKTMVFGMSKQFHKTDVLKKNSMDDVDFLKELGLRGV